MVPLQAYGETALERGNNFKQTRYQELLDLGFPKEWVDNVALHRASLFESPRAKVEGLRERGFDNPVKLITTQLSILSIGFENIDTKLEDGEKDVKQYQERDDGQPAALQNP